MVHLQRLLAVCGNGYQGRLGLGFPCNSQHYLRVVASLAGYDIKQAACGGAHTAVVTDDGTLLTFGLNDMGQLGHSRDDKFVAAPIEVGLPDPVSMVAAGEYHTLCLTNTGDVWAFGSTESRQLGIERVPDHRQVEPRLVKALQGAKVVSLAAGTGHSLALTAAGEVYSWGAGESGQLGHGAVQRMTPVEAQPRLVRALSAIPMQSITAGFFCSGAVDRQGTAHVWGHGIYHQLGLGIDRHEFLPQPIRNMPKVKQLSLGHTHGMAVDTSNKAWIWGTDFQGHMGQGESSYFNGPVRVPAPIPNAPSCSKVVCGWRHSAAITSASRLLTWGWSGSHGVSLIEANAGGGQLGLGDEYDKWAPTQVQRVHTSATRYLDLRIPQQRAWKALDLDCNRNHTAVVVEAEVDFTHLL